MYVAENSAERLGEAIVATLDDAAGRERMGRIGAERLQREKQFTSDLPTVIQEGAGWVDYDRQGPVLTDDFAPTDVLRGIPRE